MKILITPVLALSVFVSAIQVVFMQHEARRLFMEVQEQDAVRDGLDEEWGRLQLEQSTWATDDRVEQVARTDLQMREPGAGSLVLLTK